MSQEELLRQIEEWNQAGQYWKIIHAVDALPPEERGYQLTCQQARACNNLVAVKGEERSLCRHLETGRELYILNDYLRQGPAGLWCEDSTDYHLPVAPGDLLTVVKKTKAGFLCKKSGVTGWYYGRLSDIMV